jgi:hypothetical protein
MDSELCTKPLSRAVVEKRESMKSAIKLLHAERKDRGESSLCRLLFPFAFCIAS